MEQIKKHWYAKPLSVYLSLCTAFMSLLFSISIAKPAAAQEATHQPFWAVLDFENDAKYGSADIGRESGDALALELGRSNRFNVINRADVDAGLSALGLQQPLDSTDSIRLGKQINADAIVTGNVLAITQKHNPEQADVIIAVKVTDSSTGELINGALAEGLSTPRNGPAPDFDTLVTEAVSKAAFAAVKQITSYNLPQPTVLNNEGSNIVVLSMGSRDGVRAGERFMVRRSGNEVGQIQVTTVEPDQSNASVISDTLGIRPGDLCRAIYNLPDYQVHDGRVITDNGSITQGSAVAGQKKNAFSGIGGVLLAIAAAAIIIAMVNHGSNSDTIGGGAVGGVTAQAAYGNEVGLPTAPTLASDSTGVDLTLEEPSYAGIISWTPGNINPRSIVGFNIYRQGFTKYTIFGGSTGTTTTTTTTTGGTTTTLDSYIFNQGPILTVDPSSRSYVDTGVPKPLQGFEYVTSPGLSTTTGTTAGATAGGTAGTTGGSSSSSSTTSTGGSSSGGSTATSGTTAGGGVSPPVLLGSPGSVVANATVPVPPLVLGQTTNYVVSAIFQVTDLINGAPGYEETAIQSGGSGLITPTIPVDSTGTGSALHVNGVNMFNATGVNLSSMTVSFQNQAGADQYVIDFSTDPKFKANKVSIKFPQIPVSTSADVFTPTASGINLKSLFPAGTLSGGTTTIFYRIGERNSSDNPGPYRNDNFNPNPDLYPSGGTYMYSAVSEFFGS